VNSLEIVEQIDEIKRVNSTLEDFVFYEKVLNLYYSVYTLATTFENSEEILDVLITVHEEAYSGNCCSLTKDNKVDWSCCNFWESIKVTVKAAFTCNLVQFPSREDVYNFYLCYQSIICQTC